MKASELIVKLQSMIDEHGDLDVVSGIDRTGYGEPVENVDYVYQGLIDIDNEPFYAFNLVCSDTSLCVCGDW